jgi:hypothetical protein
LDLHEVLCAEIIIGFKETKKKGLELICSFTLLTLYSGVILGFDTGFTWFSKASVESDEAWMSYKVKFSPGFDWTKGGKLPGLCGGGVALLLGKSSIANSVRDVGA